MFLSLSFSILLPAIAIASHSHSHNAKRHSDLAQKVAAREPQPAEPAVFNETVYRRGSCTNARATWYDVGLGACGKTNVPSDDIIALTVQMYGDGYPGPQCFKGVTIECNGKQHSATIMDECMGCPYCGIDMSTGLFQKFDDLGAGVLTCNWWFDDGSGGGNAAPAKPPPPPPPPPPAPKPKPKPSPEPTTHAAPKPTPTTTTTHHTSHSVAHSSSHSSSSSKSSSSPAPVQTPTGPQNLKDMVQALFGIAQVVVDINN